MANIVNNLRVNNTEVKTILIKLSKNSDWQKLKEFFYNGVLVWKNANPFVFTSDLRKIDLSEFGENTIIFEGFGNLKDFIGSYSIVESAEDEKENLIRGQMIVETTTEGE